MELPIYQVDAFASRVFTGNPAAICPLAEWLPDSTLQAIAMENNLAETAYFLKTPGGYHLRWFTPANEMDLCGHATLASAYVIFRFLEPELTTIQFETLSGTLTVTRLDDLLTLDFPARPPVETAPCEGLLEALGGHAEQVLASRDYLVVYRSEADIAALQPNMMGLLHLDRFAVCVTAPSSTPGVDFVSRFFAPAAGVPEDPVTGSAHCTLVPYWAERLGKTTLTARQISPRGGELLCELKGDRVTMAGRGVLFLHGTIVI